MMHLDEYAYLSALRNTDPALKLFLALPSMGIVLWTDAAFIQLAVFLMMGWLVVFRGGLPFAKYLRVLLLPSSFLLAGVLAIAFSFTPEQKDLLVSLPVAGNYAGISADGVQQAMALFRKALAAFSCLSFLFLTTPLVTLLGTLRRFGLPKLLVEMMGLVYRFVFMIAASARTIHCAQQARLGYSGLGVSFRSAGLLSASVFGSAFRQANDLSTALEARGYRGELAVLPESCTVSVRIYVLAGGVHVVLLAGVLLSGGFEWQP